MEWLLESRYSENNYKTYRSELTTFLHWCLEVEQTWGTASFTTLIADWRRYYSPTRNLTIAARGLDPFQHFMLPHAALRLKQGFGRLIRSRSDRGTVLILDDRVVRKRYGRYLRDSLPDAPFHKGPWPEIRRLLHDFYESP